MADYQVDKLAAKLANYVACSGACADAVGMLCDCCVKRHRLAKKDIQHPHLQVVSKQPSIEAHSARRKFTPRLDIAQSAANISPVATPAVSQSAASISPVATPAVSQSAAPISPRKRSETVSTKPSLSTMSETAESGISASSPSPSRNPVLSALRSHRLVRREASDSSETGSVFDLGYSGSLCGSLGYKSDDSRKSSSSSRKDSSSSNPEFKKQTPLIDMKPIEFWAANREAVQPRGPRRVRLPSESEISIDSFNFDLYDPTQTHDHSDVMTDEELLAKYKLGKIHFRLIYDVDSQSLIISQLGARDLPRPIAKDASKQDQAHSNAYVKLSISPDQKNSKQSAVARKTQNPKWDETFAFEVSLTEAQNLTLEIVVKDFDKFSRHCIVGHVAVPLQDVNLITNNSFWKPLIPSETTKPDLGEIQLSLNYLPSAGRINVDVMKAKQLLRTDVVGEPDPFVKVTLYIGDKVQKVKKTSTRKNTMDPVFNENITLHISKEDLANATLLIGVWDHNSRIRDDLIGQIVLSDRGSSPEEINQWNLMAQGLGNPGASWHSLQTREESAKFLPNF